MSEATLLASKTTARPAKGEAKAQAAKCVTASDEAGPGEQECDESADVVKNPHDKLFRGTLASPDDAAPLLRSAISPRAYARLDLTVWEPQKTTFVTEEFRDKCTDVLYRTRLVSGLDAMVFVLIEHQSSVDKWMAYRIYCYLKDIWDYYLQCYPTADALPYVLPIVVHTNGTATAWNAATDVYGLLCLDDDDREALGDMAPRVPFVLDDVAVQDLETLRSRELTEAGFLMLYAQTKIRGCKDVVQAMAAVAAAMEALANQPGGLAKLRLYLKYALIVGEANPDEVNKFLRSRGGVIKEAIVTTAQQMDAKSRTEGRADLLLDQLYAKFVELPDWVVEAVHKADDEQIRRWSMLILTDTTLEQMFGLAAV